MWGGAGVITHQKPKGDLRVLREASQLRAEEVGSRATAQSAPRHQRAGPGPGPCSHLGWFLSPPCRYSRH